MKEKNGEHPLGDAGQLILFFVFLAVWAADSFFLHQSTFLADDVPLSIRLTIFTTILIAAFYLLMSGHAVISHGRRPDHVVSTGAFRYVRHPLYLGIILFYLGLSVSTASLFSFAFLVMVLIFYNHIAGYEEKLLELKFGEKYRTYRQKTGKWLPRITRRN